MPTVPLDPPTAWGLASLLVLIGRPLVQAGRGAAAFGAAAAFAIFFALSVQLFLFRWPDWMYAYAVPASDLPPAYVALPFFVAVAGAGIAGAYVTLQLLRSGRTGWAIANALFGIGLWLAIQAATWEQYFHVGTWDAWQRGAALPIDRVPDFQLAMTLAGAAQGGVGIGLAAWLFVAGRRARRRSRIQPDADDGSWRPPPRGTIAPGSSAESPLETSTIEGSRPRDGRPLEPVAPTPPGEIPALVQRARGAQTAWANLPIEQRARALLRLRRRFLAEGDALAQLLEEENGRPQAESWLAEILPNADLFDHWARHGPALLQATGTPLDPLLFPGKRGVVELLPRGLIGLITPWNFPLALPLRTIVPALLAGNGVIWKPSEFAARSAARLHAILCAELPDGLVALVQGGAAAGRAVIDAGVDQAGFIGSVRTGGEVAKYAAERMTPLALELGGKDAALVLHDADLERSANGIVWGAFANAGQNCAAIERCHVDARIAPRFVEMLRERITALRQGEDVGPLTTQAQLEGVVAQLEEARQRGVQVQPAPQGRWLRPVLVVDPPADLALLREETFGPVLVVQVAASEEEMVRRANDSHFGLTASIWSRDTARAEALGRRLQAGVITVNNHAFTGGLPQAPWSGVRASGSGITGGALGLMALTRPRYVLVDRSRSARELWWYPYDASVLRLARALGRLRAGGGIGAWPEALRALVGARRRETAPRSAIWPGQPVLRSIEGGRNEGGSDAQRSDRGRRVE